MVFWDAVGQQSAEQQPQAQEEQTAPPVEADANIADALPEEPAQAVPKDEPQPIGRGVFGDIYDAFRGKTKEAINFLLGKKSGEAVGALHHDKVGNISLVYGNDKYGLAHIQKRHPGVLNDLHSIIPEMGVVVQSDNRIVLESPTHKAVISKMLGNEKTDNWLLTAYEKKSPVSASSSDIETEPEGKRNGTATPQNETSDIKVSENIPNTQQSAEQTAQEEQPIEQPAQQTQPTQESQPATQETTEPDAQQQTELDQNGSYWNVNSGGVFRANYGENKRNVQSASEVQNGESVPDNTLQPTTNADNNAGSNGTVSDVSNSKDNTTSSEEQASEEKTSQENTSEEAKEPIEEGKNEFQQTADEIIADSTEAQLATDATILALTESGIEVVEATDAMAEAVMGNRVEMNAKKKRALETASVQEEHQPTVVSSADGAKVLNNLDNVANEYEEKSNQPKTFLGDIAKALGAERKGSGSQYVTFETKNGMVVTIRLSNHNAKVSNFDNNGEAEGISIVVSAKGNTGITNDGDAHIVEYYYDAIKLRRADGKPLADIVRSIKQALYSGEFKDATGLAERQEVNLNEIEAQIIPNNPIFYSNAEHTVRNIKQEKATPQQWLAMIEKQGGLKVGEDKWLGLSDWLKGSDAKTLTKQEVLDYIAQNKIVIEEVGYGGDSMASAQSEFDELTDELGSYDEAFDEMANRYGDDFREAVWYDEVGQLHFEEGYEGYGDILGGERGINPTRMSYTTEGLENNKEIALVVPSVDPYNQSDEIHFGDAGGGRAVAWVRFGETRAPRQVEEVRSADELEAPFKNVNGKDVWKVKGRKKDYIAHAKLKNGMERYLIYVNDRLIGTTLDDTFDTLEEAQEAMNRYYAEHPIYKTVYDNVLVIDEIQSKRHQEGREKGYRPSYEKQLAMAEGAFEESRKKYDDAVKRHNSVNDALLSKYGIGFDSATESELQELRDAYEDMQFAKESMNVTKEKLVHLSRGERGSGIPSAPFEKNWHELAMKRMLRYAAENGFDKVAWTTGAQQAERYDIGNMVSGIEVRRDNAEGEYNVITYDASGNIMPSGSGTMTPQQITETFGKELGQKMLAVEAGETSTFDGGDLRLGGEGMKGFYDKMLPSFMSKYGKKWGVKVGKVTMPDLQEGSQTMHSIDVTDAMKESVMEGQPMFLRTPQGTVYGWTDGERIYLTKEGMNPETPIHEYTHLWARAMMQRNAEGWQSVKDLLRDTPIWQEVLNDVNYANIRGNEDAIASEALSRLSGRQSAQKMQEMARRLINEGNSNAQSLISRMRQALQEFWNWVGTNLFGIKSFDSIEEVTDRVLWDILNGTDLGNLTPNQNELMILGEKGASALDKADEATHRMDNLEVAREMEAEGKDTKAIRMATGWERGADGKWRYEIEDFKRFDPYGNILYEMRHPDYTRYLQLTKKRTSSLLLRTEPLTDAEMTEHQELVKKWGELMDKHDDIHTLEAYIDAPDLFKAYPQLRNIKLRYVDSIAKGQFVAPEGEVDGEEKEPEILISKSLFTKAPAEIEHTLIHEIQHAIQRIEGFAKGGNPRMFATPPPTEFEQTVNELNEFLPATQGENAYAKIESLLFNPRLEAFRNTLMSPDAKENIATLQRLFKEWDEKRFMDEWTYTLELYNDSQKDPFTQYRRLAGEVEARNVQSRMGYTEQQRRETLLAETEDVTREDQIFLMENSGVSAMGSRVEKRRAEIAEHFNGQQLSGNSQSIINAFALGSKNETIEAKGKRIILKQGNENKAGVSHSLMRHYGTITGNYSADELLLIPQIIEQGERKQDGKKISYKLERDGVTYTVTTEIRNRIEA